VLLGVYGQILRFPEFRGKSRLREVVRSLLEPSVSTVYSGRIRMRLDPNEWVQCELIERGWIERRITHIAERVLKPGDAFVDVGSHVGYHTLVGASLVGDKGQVIAIDPLPYNCNCILANARLNSFENILVIVAAAGAADGFATLNNQIPQDTAQLSLAHWPHAESRQKFSVTIRTLDSLTGNLDSIALMKIDVEGYELEVLKGAPQSLGKTQNLVIELDPRNLCLAPRRF
jgi:FkbM family methyltransferase